MTDERVCPSTVSAVIKTTTVIIREIRADRVERPEAEALHEYAFS